MRVISGTLRGRRIDPPSKKFPTRPTTDFVRENLFNLLSNQLDFEESKLLDLFGGFGMIGIEAASRSCQDVTYVDSHRGCHAFMKQTIEKLAIEDQFSLFCRDVFKFIKHCDKKFDIIFADPPYDYFKNPGLAKAIFDADLLEENGVLIIEHAAHLTYSTDPRFTDQRKYGQSVLSFFR